MQDWQQPRSNSPRPPAWASWSDQQRGEGLFGDEAGQQGEQFVDAEGDNGSSRASSPSKSPLLQSTRFLDQTDQPLLRHPRAVRLSHQSAGGGSEAGDQLQRPIRPSMWPAQQDQGQHQPSSPVMSEAQYNSWYQQQGPDSRAADRAAAVGSSGGYRGERGAPPPNRRTLFAQQAEQQQQQARQQQQYQQPQQSETSRSDGASGRQPFEQLPPQQPLYGGAAASDPMTYHAFDRDGVPNMGDVTHDNGGGGWQIPAMRPANTPPSMQHTRHSPAPSLSGRRGGPGGDKKTPGAVVKLGRRQAWLKFLAYEGCWQICLDSFLQPSSSGEARQFLEDGCNLLRTALGLDSLLLTSVLRNPATNLAGGSAEAAIYWDDKEEGALTAVEIETKLVQQPQQPALPPPQQPPKPPPMQPVLQPAPPPPRAPAAMPLLSGGSSSSANGKGPFLEASVVRVVGCDALNPANTMQYYLVLYPSGKSATDGGAWTLVSTDGSTHGHEAIELDPNLRQDTLAVELLEEDVALAMGTIQIAELHKLANQQDVFADDSPPPGFFKSLFPCWRTKGSTHSRMAWIKLVDNSGRTCGHAVLSARMVSATVGEMGFLGPRTVRDGPIFEEVGTLTGDQQYPQLKQRYQQTQQQAQYPSIHPQQIQQQQQQQQQPPAPPPYPQQQQGAGTLARQPQPVQLPARREVTTCVVRVDPNSAAKQKNSAGGYLHVTALQVYDELLAAALKAEDCGTRKLELFGPWKWLLQEFAAVYGVRHFYTSLSYLKWVVRPENASVTALCFNVLLRELVSLKQAQVNKQLSSGELGVLAQVSQRIEELLTQCFENYFMLSEDAPNGMMEGALSIRGHIPPVLQPAVALFGLLRDGMSAADQEWLAERFSVAAKKRFQGLLTATALQNPGSGGDRRGMANNGQDSPAAIQAYSSVEELSKAIMNELRADEGIRGAKVLPSFINLPDITSVEYVQGIIRHLGHVLRRHPPPAPTEPAVLLVEAVGQLQAFVYRHEYWQANALLNSREIFGKFVHEWINNSYALLTQRCRALEAAAPAMAGWQDFDAEGKHRVAPLVEEMLSATEGEMGRYERIITYWPMYGPDLEKCVTGALRESTISVSRQCGLVNTKEGNLPPNGQGQMVVARHGASPATRGGRTGWAWATPHFDRMVMPATFHGMPVCLQQGINPNQALLLNSLRRLLAVSPQLEHRLVRWCGGADALIQSQTNFQAAVGAERIARDAPNLGAQFAQMVKELRSEYFAAITLCAEKLSSTLAGQPATSVILILRHHGLKAQSAQTQGALTRIMEELEKLLLWLNSTLDNRVFVALTRGLWDLASKDVLQYAEDLNEAAEHNSWRGRQNASVAIKVLDQFFKGALTASMGNDLQNKDLALPAHSDRAHKLLAENLTSVAMSYDVF